MLVILKQTSRAKRTVRHAAGCGIFMGRGRVFHDSRHLREYQDCRIASNHAQGIESRCYFTYQGSVEYKCVQPSTGVARFSHGAFFSVTCLLRSWSPIFVSAPFTDTWSWGHRIWGGLVLGRTICSQVLLSFILNVFYPSFQVQFRRSDCSLDESKSIRGLGFSNAGF